MLWVPGDPVGTSETWEEVGSVPDPGTRRRSTSREGTRRGNGDGVPYRDEWLILPEAVVYLSDHALLLLDFFNHAE